MRFLIIPWVFWILMGGGLLAQGGVIDIGVATREAEGVVSIRVVSPDDSVRQTALRAFNLHGGFRVEVGDRAAVTATLVPSGNAIQLTVRSGSREASRTLRGADLRQSVLLACDAVVEAVHRTPGFFASRLVFVGRQRGAMELYTSDLLFGNVRPLTNDRSQVVSPRWSPDGNRIVYTSYHGNGFPDIFMIDLTSGMRTAVATFRGTNTGAVFSPDGSRLAMSLSGSGNAELYVGDANGRGLRRLTNNRSIEASPSWSPDGRRLVFTSDTRGRPQLYQIDVEGGAMRAVPTAISGYVTEPQWNPRNPNLIAFTAATTGGFQIAVYDFQRRGNEASRFVTQVPESGVEPYWLNDGRHLIFTERRSGTRRLVILDTETGRTRPLHDPAFGDAFQASAVYPRR